MRLNMAVFSCRSTRMCQETLSSNKPVPKGCHAWRLAFRSISTSLRSVLSRQTKWILCKKFNDAAKLRRQNWRLATGDSVLSAVEISTQLKGPARREKLARLSPAPRRRINRILSYIQRSAAATSPGVKVPDSDNVKKLGCHDSVLNIGRPG